MVNEIEGIKCKGIMREYIRDPAANACIVAKINGNVEEKHLKSALKKVRKLHHLLGVRVVFDINHEAWLTDKDVPPIPLKIIERESDNQWRKIAANEINIYLNLEKGPLIKFILLKSPEVSEIIIISHHSICDGKSLVNLVHDTLFFLSEPEKKVKKIETVLPTSAYFPANSFISKLELMMNRVYFNMINRKWDKQKILFDEEDYRNMHEVFYKKYRYKIIDTELSSLQTSALVNKCRKNQVTVNSALSVAFLAASYDICGANTNHNIEIGVNIRDKFNRPSDDAFGFLASCINLEFEYNPEITFWDNVYSFHKQILPVLKENEIIKNYRRAEYIDPTLIDAIRFATYGRWISNELNGYKKLSNFLKNENNIAVDISKQKISSMPYMSMSNLGQFNFPRNYGSLKLNRLYIVTNSSPTLDLVVGAVTFGGKLTLTLNFMEDNVSNKTFQMEETMKRAKEYLNEAIPENSSGIQTQIPVKN